MPGRRFGGGLYNTRKQQRSGKNWRASFLSPTDRKRTRKNRKRK